MSSIHYHETKNQTELMRQVLALVKNDVVVMMADDRGQWNGENKDEHISIKVRRYKTGEYKIGLYTAEGHTWVKCYGCTEMGKIWQEIDTECHRQREELLSPRLIKLMKRALISGSARVE